jgi:pyruvate ferredoxin oxidoreductase alpha subunit
MAECLPYASGARMPIVMMNANRALATPWNIYGDQMDAMFLLNSGWIQVYVEDAQEALDMMIQAYKIAEHPEVMAPMMVNLDGFVLTHTYELVEIPTHEEVDAYLPPINLTEQVMTLDNPKSLCISAGNDFNMEFKIKQEKDLQASRKIINEVDKSFGEKFGRYYNGLIDTYQCDDAEVVLVTTGSITGTTRIVVDKLRNEGHKVGVLKLRYIRPFPEDEIRTVLKDIKRIGVIDKNISFGYEGTIYTNVNSTLLNMKNAPESYNFIGGLGGRDITKENIEEAYMMLLNDKSIEKVNYMNVRCDV